MKRTWALIMALAMILVLSTSAYALFGNKDYFDTVKTYHEAMVYMPDGTTLHGKVQNWRDYENSDQIQVKIDNVTYLVHSTNIVLIHNH